MANCHDCEGYADARKGVALCPFHAAAPALLEALETLATNYETSYRRRGGTSTLPELDKARVAIAQAKGETANG